MVKYEVGAAQRVTLIVIFVIKRARGGARGRVGGLQVQKAVIIHTHEHTYTRCVWLGWNIRCCYSPAAMAGA